MPDASDDEPKTYLIRVGEEAFDNIEAATERFDVMEGGRIALEWQAKLYDFAATLAQFPHRYPLAPESDLFRVPVRDPVYRRASRSAPYRVLYTIVEADTAQKMGEVPFVLLLAVRHAAGEAVDDAEVKRIEARTSLLPPNGSN